MNYVTELQAEKVKLGSVFYVEDIGYAVVTSLKEKKEGKAYTIYNRPLDLVCSDGNMFKVYLTPSKKEGGADESIAADKDVCTLLEFDETDKMLSIEVDSKWEELLGKNASDKLANQLVTTLRNQLHTRQMAAEETKWDRAVAEFRENQKPLRVSGRWFKPATVIFVCGYEQNGERHLFFVKKISNLIYRVTQDITKENAPYQVVECSSDMWKEELALAVHDGLIPMIAYEYLFGRSTKNSGQVSGPIPVEIQERMKWSGYSLPQVIQAGIQALEDTGLSKMTEELKQETNVLVGPMYVKCR